jgi:hypothetical protein
VGRILGRGRQRSLNHGCNLIIFDGSRAARASLVIKIFKAILQEPPPFADGVLVSTQPSPNGLAGKSVSTAQDHLTAIRKRTGDAMTTNLALEIGPFLSAQIQRCCRPAQTFRHQPSSS